MCLFIVNVLVGEHHPTRHRGTNKITDRKTQDLTSYVDIKSNQLQEILVKVFKDVRDISIREDKPTIRTLNL